MKSLTFFVKFVLVLASCADALHRTKRDSIGQNRLGNNIYFRKRGHVRRRPKNFKQQIAMELAKRGLTHAQIRALKLLVQK